MESIQSGITGNIHHDAYALQKGKKGERKVPSDGFSETSRGETPDSEKLKEMKTRMLVENLTRDDATSKAIEQHRGLRRGLISNMTAVVAGLVLAVIADRGGPAMTLSPSPRETQQEEEQKAPFGLVKNIILLVLLSILSLPYFFNPDYFGLLDYCNLPFHEAGHFIFGIFGSQTLGVMGGTMGQLFVPASFLVYFFLRKDYSALGFSFFWLSQNLVNIARYMADAQIQALPLFGGDIHDWAYLFAEFKCITRTDAIAGAVRAMGILGMIAAIMAFILMIYYSLAGQGGTDDRRG